MSLKLKLSLMSLTLGYTSYFPISMAHVQAFSSRWREGKGPVNLLGVVVGANSRLRGFLVRATVHYGCVVRYWDLAGALWQRWLSLCHAYTKVSLTKLQDVIGVCSIAPWNHESK